jgi:GTP-binding protein HflX
VKDSARTTGVQSERALLAGVLLGEPADPLRPLAELAGLAGTAGAVVVGELTQRRDRPDQATCLGSGKVKELVALVEHTDADVVLFDNDLSPGQTRNLEKALGVKVLDRSEVILDIFAARARTYEARLAVELAQLEYSLPRLKRMWTHLSRMKMGIGMRGPGEKQLEVDRRLVEKRIHDLRGELMDVHARRERQVASRGDRMTVSLVGYTNAGKSTLLNALTGSDELAADKLFATLDTRTRRWRLPGWGPVLLSDTVGFIRDLPHRLIASFKATLEETRQADLLLHVADASSPHVEAQITAVQEVLAELGCDEKDTILVLNKTDRLLDPGKGADSSPITHGDRNSIDHDDHDDREGEGRRRLDRLLDRHPHAVAISAGSGDGLPDLAEAASRALGRGFLDVQVDLEPGDGRLLAWLAAHGEVTSRRFTNERVAVRCRLPAAMLGRMPAGALGTTVRGRSSPDGLQPDSEATAGSDHASQAFRRDACSSEADSGGTGRTEPVLAEGTSAVSVRVTADAGRP